MASSLPSLGVSSSAAGGLLPDAEPTGTGKRTPCPTEGRTPGVVFAISRVGRPEPGSGPVSQLGRRGDAGRGTSGTASPIGTADPGSVLVGPPDRASATGGIPVSEGRRTD